MLMFAPPRYELLEHCDRLRAYSGGSESNVAIGLYRLGMHAAWIGKLPRNALGRKVVNEIRAYGVDTSACIWTDQGRVGTFFVEWGAHPRPLKTIYDRAGSAATTLVADDVDWAWVQRAEWLHMTGITPALSPTCGASVPQIASRARSLGLKVSFDVNYRSLLWTPREARPVLDEILAHVDLLIATADDARMLIEPALEQRPSPESPPVDAQAWLAEQLWTRYQPEAVVLTCGGAGCAAYDGRELLRAPGHNVHVVNRLGAGDAFDAGLLYGYLTADLRTGLEMGCAMAALKLTIPQNTPLIDRADVDRLLAGRDVDIVR
jgi:2-dehydro-3-deoxygluconokinase